MADKLDPGRVAELAAAENYIKLKEELLALTREEQRELIRNSEITDKQRELLEVIAATRRRSAESLKEEVKNLKVLIEAETDRITRNEMLGELHQKRSQLARQEIADLHRKAEAEGEMTSEMRDQLEVAKKTLKNAQFMIKGQAKQKSIMKSMSPLAAKMEENVAAMAAAAEQGAGSFAKMGLAMGSQGAMKAASGIFDKFINTIKDLIFGMDEVTNAFERQYQVGAEYEQSIKSQYKDLNHLNVSMQEVAETQGAMIDGFTDFTMLGKEQRDMLTESANVMQELGIKQQDFASIVQTSTKAFGMSVEESEESVRELAETARALGRAPGELAAEFAKAGPALAKFGKDGTQTFKELARVSKITGMEIDKLLNMTNKFDTFEGAATQAGQLNAALGGNFVNAMDMMTATDPVERFEMLRNSLLDAGLSFDSMSYYQRQFYAEAMGLDSVNDLALMMSGNMDSLSGATQKSASELEEEAERAQEVQTIMEKLQLILVENADEFMELAGLLEKGVQTLAKYGHWLPRIAKLMIGMKVASFGLAVAQMALGIATTFSGRAGQIAGRGLMVVAIAIALIGAAMMFGSPSQVVMAMFGLAAGIFAVGVAGKAGSVGLGIVAATLPMIALSVFIVAAGVALMALAFSQLDVAQLIGVNVALVVLGVALYFIIPALLGAGAAAVAAAPGLGILSGIFLAIGGSIFLAASGVALMGLGLAQMFQHMDVEKMLAFTAFIGVLILGAPYFAVAGTGLLIMAAGMLGLALGLAMIKTADLEAISKFTESVANIELSAMAELVTLIQEVAEAMEEMPTDKAITLTAAMDSAAAAAQAAEILIKGGGLSGGGSASSSNSRGGGDLGTITLTFDNEMFEDKVIDLIDDEYGELIAEAARGE